jgi:hypothetical protein
MPVQVFYFDIPLSSQKFLLMEETKKSTGLYWLLFFLSTAIFIYLCMYHGDLLSAAIPFVCFFLVKALDII